ncbi:hypothetical protein LFL97_33440 [Burkholderia sp. JSH-S8]|nr:hypothetical protein LFL97_33440 [Burkholderia sp. JSH-S8]
MTTCEDSRAARSHGDACALADYIAIINQQMNGATRYLFRGQRDASCSMSPMPRLTTSNFIEHPAGAGEFFALVRGEPPLPFVIVPRPDRS